MAQTSSPNADTSAGNWTTAPLFSKVDDATPDDSDYISQSSGSLCVLAFSSIGTPNLSRGMVYLYVRARQSGLPSGSLRILVGHTDTPSDVSWTVYPPGDFVTFARSFTAAELALFTWSNLRVSFLYTGSGTCDVSWAQILDNGTMQQGAPPLDDADMFAGGVCSVTGLDFPASQLMTVDGQRMWIKTRREPKRDKGD